MILQNAVKSACLKSCLQVFQAAEGLAVPSGRMFSSMLKQPVHMEDEYGCGMNESCLNFHVPSFTLENETVLSDVSVNYASFGKQNEQKDNTIFICHALTGNAALDSWWGGLLGPDKTFDTNRYHVVCANILGSCYGTTGPTSVNPHCALGSRYGKDFPDITVRDTVKLHKLLLTEELGVEQVQSVIGGSLGGMQALEWAFFGPEFVKTVVPIACGSHHTAWQIAVSELQRQAIYMDPLYLGGNYDANNLPSQGLSLARQIAMVSYRTHAAYKEKYGRKLDDDDIFHVQSYLKYQGEKFNSRFDPNSYILLTKLMDSHDVGRGRGGVVKALASLDQPVHIMGVDSDVLYPLSEQEELHNQIPNASLAIIESKHGHDGFLLEQDQISASIKKFLAINCNS